VPELAGARGSEGARLARRALIVRLVRPAGNSLEKPIPTAQDRAGAATVAALDR